jgi:hypothetical protein
MARGFYDDLLESLFDHTEDPLPEDVEKTLLSKVNPRMTSLGKGKISLKAFEQQVKTLKVERSSSTSVDDMIGKNSAQIIEEFMKRTYKPGPNEIAAFLGSMNKHLTRGSVKTMKEHSLHKHLLKYLFINIVLELMMCNYVYYIRNYATLMSREYFADLIDTFLLGRFRNIHILQLH